MRYDKKDKLLHKCLFELWHIKEDTVELTLNKDELERIVTLLVLDVSKEQALVEIKEVLLKHEQDNNRNMGREL